MMKVFIADDSEILRERLKALLSEVEGVEIIGEADNGPEALSGVCELSPDILILDIRMPGGSGIQVLPEVKKHEPSPTVIMLTNYPNPKYRQKCKEAGAEFFFDKSSEFEELMSLLKELIVSRGGGSKKILIVDDNINQCKSMAMIFERKGFDCTIAEDGLEAIAKVRETSFDNIFMDIRMPHIDGVETYRRIKKIQPQAVVTMITGYVVEDLVQEVLHEGAYKVLYKPLDMEEVLHVLNKAGEAGHGIGAR